MIKTKFYNPKKKEMQWKARLTKGEQYDLMKRNIELLQSSAVDSLEDISAQEWEDTFNTTVRFADNGNGLEYEPPTSEAHEFELNELTGKN